MGRAILFLVSGFILIFGIIQMSLQDRRQVLAKRSAEYHYEEQSSNIAGATMEIALAKLNDNYLTPIVVDGTTVTILNGIGKINFYSAPAYFNSRVFLEIKGIVEHGSAKTVTTIRAVVNRPAFSIYSYFTDEEPTIYFTTGDILNGPVHTNGTFHIHGDPIFNGKVTSPNQPIVTPGSNPVYKKGHDFNSAVIPMPGADDMNIIVESAKDGGLYFDKPIRVKFKADGTVDISQMSCTSYDTDFVYGMGNKKHCNDFEVLSTQTYNLSDYNGVISSAEDVQVSGTLNGQVTLHSAKDIILIGDVEYENTNFGNGEENAGQEHEEEDEGDWYDHEDEGISDDLLGLVAEKEIMVEEDAHQRGPGGIDITIHASVLALGTFFVEDYGDGTERGYINLVGGLIQKKRGPVGLVSGSGYLKNYSYDERFLTNSTRGFPKVKRFEIDSWRETTETIES